VEKYIYCDTTIVVRMAEKRTLYFHLGWRAGWKKTIGKTETMLGGQY